MSFSQPLALILLGLSPVLLWLLRGVCSWPLRIWLMLLLTLVAIAAAGPRAGARAEGRRVFLLIDRSASCRGDEGWKKLQGLVGRLRERDRLWIVPFGKQPALAAGPIAPDQLVEELGRLKTAVVDPDATSVGEALSFVSTLEPGPADVVLFSDGIDSPRGPPWVAPSGKRVFVLRPAVRSDMRILSVRTPPRLGLGVRFSLAVQLAATAPSEGTLRVERGGRLVAQEPVSIGGVGRVTVLVADRVDELGLVDYQVTLIPAKGEITQGNNRFHLRRRIGGKPGVIWLGRSTPVARALARYAQIQFVRPAELTDGHFEEGVSAVVLDDLSADSFTPDVERRLLDFIRRGGGCLFLGGRRSLADGGWIERPLENRLPVNLRPRSKPRPPAAVAVLIDSSGSMSRNKMEVVRSALGHLVDGLSPGTELTIWGFALSPKKLLGPVKIVRGRRIDLSLPEAGSGSTHIGPVLAQAHAAISRSTLAERHLLLISDGQTIEKALPSLDLSSSGTTLTVLRIGDRPVSSAFGRFIGQVGGTTYAVPRVDDLPRILLARYKARHWRLVTDEPQAVRPASGQLGQLASAHFPDLAGMVRTSLKPGAHVLLKAAENPVYADWSLGGARVAYLGLDLSGPWGGAYRSWDQTANLVGHALLRVAASRSPQPIDLRVDFVDGQVELAAVVRDRGVRNLTVTARSGGRSRRLLLDPVRPGVYRGRLSLAPGRTWSIYLEGAEGRLITPPYGPELGRLVPDLEALALLASSSGGKVLAQLDRFRPSPPVSRPGRSISRLLWLLSCGLLLLGVGAHRWIGR